MALDVLEKQRRAAGSAWQTRPTLTYAVGNFSDFEDGIYFGANCFQFAGALQRRDPIPQIIVGQNLPPFGNRIITAATHI